MRAFIFFFVLAIFVFWIILSMEHGKALGNKILHIKRFWKGEVNANEQDNR